MLRCFSSSIPLLTLNKTFFGFQYHPPIYSHAWLLPVNTWWMIVLWFHNYYTGTWGPLRILQLMCNATAVQGYAMVTLNLVSCNYQWIIVFIQVSPSTWTLLLLLSILKFLSLCRMKYLILQLSFAGRLDSCFGLVGISSMGLYSRMIYEIHIPWK